VARLDRDRPQGIEAHVWENHRKPTQHGLRIAADQVICSGRRDAAVPGVVVVKRCADLLEVILTAHPRCGVTGALHRRQEKA
jgi:hypothetical protein